MQTELNFDKPKRRMHANSLDAYHNEVKPTLKGRKLIVYEAIKKMPKCTMKDVATYLNVPLNTISGRFSQLRDTGFIKEVGSIKISKTTCTQWEVTDMGL